MVYKMVHLVIDLKARLEHYFLRMTVFFLKRKMLLMAFRNCFNVEILTIKVGRHTWYKLNLCSFTFNMDSMLCMLHDDCKCD